MEKHFFAVNNVIVPAQRMKFFTKVFFSKCDQIVSLLRIWSHLLKKSWMKNFIFVQCVQAKQQRNEVSNDLPGNIDGYFFTGCPRNPKIKIDLFALLEDCHR